jgi:hypothetical protein
MAPSCRDSHPKANEEKEIASPHDHLQTEAAQDSTVNLDGDGTNDGVHPPAPAGTQSQD